MLGSIIMRSRLVICLVLIVLAESTARSWAVQDGEIFGHRTPKDKRPQVSEVALVQEALAGFVSGVQHGMPGVAAEYFAPEILPGPLSGREELDQFYAAIRSMKSVGDNPILLIVMPRISFKGGKASVDCCVIWYFQNKNGEIIEITDREHLTLAKQSGRYRIIESSLSPVVLTQCNSKESLSNAIRKNKAQERMGD